MSLLKALHLANDGSTPDIDRRFMGAISLDGSRVIGSTSFVVSEKSGTPNMSVDVAAGRAWVLGTDSTFQGSYFVDSTATENVVIAAADATNPRIDLIVATVRDDTYGSGNDDWILQAIQGTPAAGPTAPSVPDTSIVLARVDVEANETAIENAHVTDLRTSVTYNGGGYLTKNGLVVASATNYPASPETGDTLYSTSEALEMVYTGSKWVPVSGSKTVFVETAAPGPSSVSTTTWTTITSSAVTVPTWATSANIHGSLAGVFNGTTSSASANFRIQLGGQTSNEVRVYGTNIGVANQRYGVPLDRTLTSPSTGAQTMTVQAQVLSGAGNVQWDTAVRTGAMITFRP